MGAILVLVSLVLTGCVSLRIKAIPPAENQVDAINLCLGIESDGDLISPVGVRDSFTVLDGRVYCFLRLKEVGDMILIKWRWYSPDKIST